MKSIKWYTILESFKDAKRIWGVDNNKDEIDLYINQFKKLKDRNQITTKEKDISFWIKKDFSEFKSFVDNVKDNYETKIPIKKQASDKDAPIVYENDKVVVRKILSKAASCKYGSDTNWCITKQNHDYYEAYTNDDGKQFYFIIMKNPDELEETYGKLAIDVDMDGDFGFWDRDNIAGKITYEDFKDLNSDYYGDIPIDTFEPKVDELSELIDAHYSAENMERILELYPNSIVKVDNIENEDGLVYLYKYGYLVDMAKMIGDDTFKDYIPYLEWDEFFEYYSSDVSDDEVEDLADELGIEVDDDNIDNLKRAVAVGHEEGTMDNLHKTATDFEIEYNYSEQGSEYDNLDHIFNVNYEDGEYYLVISCFNFKNYARSIIKYIKKEGDLEDGITIKLDVPYYGFDGYSEAAAIEYYKELD